jgi:hypothetical protein
MTEAERNLLRLLAQGAELLRTADLETRQRAAPTIAATERLLREAQQARQDEAKQPGSALVGPGNPVTAGGWPP